MNFYAEVNKDNAQEWYNELPIHLRKTIDEKIALTPTGETCTSSNNPGIWKQVKEEVGTRPKPLPTTDHPGDGYTSAQIAAEEVRVRWVKRYDELLLTQVVLEHAPRIQAERKMLSQALGLNEGGNGFPAQSDGLDDTQAATVRWIQSTGQTPLEFLADTYRNDDVKAGDRINAAKAMLDFVHRKVPVKTEVETKDVTEPKLDAKVLKGLSDKELATLESLLKKMGKV